MGEKTAISWCDHTFNPWIGCTKVTPACDGCYAENLMDLRYGRVKWGPHGERVRTAAANWKKPIAWNKAAGIAGTRPRVFCASLADVFDNQVPPSWREDLFELIRITPNLTWLLLTKRPQNIVAMVQTSGAIAGNGTRYLPGNAALGTTIEDQKRADINVPALLDAKYNCGPAFAFVSCEPLLGAIDLRRVCLLPKRPGSNRTGIHIDALGGRYCESGLRYTGPWDVRGEAPPADAPAVYLDGVIGGGETDQGKHRARPTHPDWMRSLRDQCKAAGRAFHLKQWGEWGMPTDDLGALDWPYHPDHDRTHWFDRRTCARPTEPGWSDKYKGGGGALPPPPFDLWQTPEYLDQVARCPQADCRAARKCVGNSARAAVTRVGKARAGRLLDGVEHNDFPTKERTGNAI